MSPLDEPPFLCVKIPISSSPRMGDLGFFGFILAIFLSFSSVVAPVLSFGQGLVRLASCGE